MRQTTRQVTELCICAADQKSRLASRVAHPVAVWLAPVEASGVVACQRCSTTCVCVSSILLTNALSRIGLVVSSYGSCCGCWPRRSFWSFRGFRGSPCRIPPLLVYHGTLPLWASRTWSYLLPLLPTNLPPTFNCFTLIQRFPVCASMAQQNFRFVTFQSCWKGEEVATSTCTLANAHFYDSKDWENVHKAGQVGCMDALPKPVTTLSHSSSIESSLEQ